MDDQNKNYNQPVAYDAEGRPLYAHPPQASELPAMPPPIGVPTHSHGSSPVPAHEEPALAANHDEANARHAASKAKYPNLNLSEGEYVIEEIRRHPIGLLPIAAVAGLVITACLGLIIMYPSIEKSGILGEVPPASVVVLPVALVAILAALLAYVAASIYNANRFYLTNESVIEETQASLFASKERTVGLHSIEEVTFKRSNLFQNMFSYGTVDLTIEGHTVYHFPYVGNPKERVDLIVNTVEKVKAGHH